MRYCFYADAKDGRDGKESMAAATAAVKLIGLIALSDPPRVDSKAVIQRLNALGVRVKMLTGVRV